MTPASPDRAVYRTRARTIILWCVLALCLSTLPGGYLIDHCPYELRDPLLHRAVCAWQNAQPAFDAVILGSSRLGSFVRTPDLRRITNELLGTNSPRIYNAAITAGEPITLNLLTRQLLATKAPPPRIAFVEVGPDLLARNNRYYSQIVIRQLVASDLPKYTAEILLTGYGTTKLAESRLIPFYTHRAALTGWLTQTVCDPSGTNYCAGTADASRNGETTSFQTVRDAAARVDTPLAERIKSDIEPVRRRLRHYNLNSRSRESFEQMIATFHAAHCWVVLIGPPVSSAHQQLFTAEVREPFAKWIHQLHDQYGCEFADFSGRLPDESFFDNHHATNAGSMAFTELFAREVVAPAWRHVSSDQDPD